MNRTLLLITKHYDYLYNHKRNFAIMVLYISGFYLCRKTLHTELDELADFTKNEKQKLDNLAEFTKKRVTGIIRTSRIY